MLKEWESVTTLFARVGREVRVLTDPLDRVEVIGKIAEQVRRMRFQTILTANGFIKGDGKSSFFLQASDNNHAEPIDQI